MLLCRWCDVDCVACGSMGVAIAWRHTVGGHRSYSLPTRRPWSLVSLIFIVASSPRAHALIQVFCGRRSRIGVAVGLLLCTYGTVGHFDPRWCCIDTCASQCTVTLLFFFSFLLLLFVVLLVLLSRSHTQIQLSFVSRFSKHSQ